MTMLYLSCMRRLEINPVQFSDEFVDFLQNMGSRVYKYRQKFNEPSTTERDCMFPRVDSVLTKSTVRKTQNNLNGILMMKLVAFYENKYTLNPFIGTTTVEVSTSRAVPTHHGVVELRAMKTSQENGPEQFSEIQEIIVI
ncbi:uncharacterized protein LOC133516896 isoform X2 [Cydia pomonella]|uniref:uncharacterized protein LOC133516896 isoform X2 n=1 Tax=Cydia pomonella TaxID=82600 RepID=UPI002ADDA4A6|nr:uncharacterized protein LOC133516896 isoform X2 [Cydia pomonella]